MLALIKRQLNSSKKIALYSGVTICHTLLIPNRLSHYYYRGQVLTGYFEFRFVSMFGIILEQLNLTELQTELKKLFPDWHLLWVNALGSSETGGLCRWVQWDVDGFRSGSTCAVSDHSQVNLRLFPAASELSTFRPEIWYKLVTGSCQLVDKIITRQPTERCDLGQRYGGSNQRDA